MLPLTSNHSSSQAFSLDDLSFAEIEHGRIRREAEQLVQDACEAIAQELHVRDGVILAEAREAVLADALIDVLDAPSSVERDVEVYTLTRASSLALRTALEDGLRVFLQRAGARNVPEDVRITLTLGIPAYEEIPLSGGICPQ